MEYYEKRAFEDFRVREAKRNRAMVLDLSDETRIREMDRIGGLGIRRKGGLNEGLGNEMGVREGDDESSIGQQRGSLMQMPDRTSTSEVMNWS